MMATIDQLENAERMKQEKETQSFEIDINREKKENQRFLQEQFG